MLHFLGTLCSFQGKNDKKLLDAEGYHLISIFTYADLSKRKHMSLNLSLWVVPISENLASGPWTKYLTRLPYMEHLRWRQIKNYSSWVVPGMNDVRSSTRTSFPLVNPSTQFMLTMGDIHMYGPSHLSMKSIGSTKAAKSKRALRSLRRAFTLRRRANISPPIVVKLAFSLRCHFFSTGASTTRSTRIYTSR